MVTLITSLLVDIGNETLPGGGGGAFSMLWTGLSPFIAIMCLHYLFKKMKVPSPFSPTSAAAYGKAAANGRMGGAVTTGVVGGATTGLMNKWGQRGASRAQGMAKDGAKAAIPGLQSKSQKSAAALAKGGQVATGRTAAGPDVLEARNNRKCSLGGSLGGRGEGATLPPTSEKPPQLSNPVYTERARQNPGKARPQRRPAPPYTTNRLQARVPERLRLNRATPGRPRPTRDARCQGAGWFDWARRPSRMRH